MTTGDPIPGQTPQEFTGVAPSAQLEGQAPKVPLREVLWNKGKMPVKEKLEKVRQYPIEEQLGERVMDHGETYRELRSGVDEALRNNPDYTRQVLDSYMESGRVPDTIRLTVGDHLYSIAHEESHMWGKDGYKEKIINIKRRANDGADELRDTDEYGRVVRTGQPYWEEHWDFSVDTNLNYDRKIKDEGGTFSYVGPETRNKGYYSNMTGDTAYSAVKALDLINDLKGEKTAPTTPLPSSPVPQSPVSSPIV